MVDDLMGEVDPAAFGQDAHQLLLDFLRRLGFGQAETPRDAEDVRVHDYTFGFAEGYTEDDVGRLAGRAGNGD